MIFQIENKNIYASDAGQGIDTQKETIVFLHGSGMSHIIWSLTEQFFSNQNFNVLSIDLPGHGNSDGPCINTIEKITEWLEKAFNQLNLNDYRIWYYLGKSYLGLNEYIDAAKSFRKALKINPDDSESYFLLGISYIKLNKLKKANETLDFLYMLDRSLFDSLKFEIKLVELK